ncbi:hypothetical protein RRF57_001358 [Xylaria bambusicola]|uniref:Uncharacterized protein n=1 Tax=Xylaria bambusicola TaxID=326684 RepID=A0AAN7Z1J0_9PEZI
MPRSGYDSTNCTNSEKQRTEASSRASSDRRGTVAGTIRIPRNFRLLSIDQNLPSPSASRTPITTPSATAHLPSSNPSLASISSVVSTSRSSTVPFQERSTNIQSSAGPASGSANPTASPTPSLHAPSANRTALPTVRDQGANRNRTLTPRGIEDLGGNALQQHSQDRVRESFEDLEPGRKVDERYAISPLVATLIQAAKVLCRPNPLLRMILFRKVNKLTKDMPVQKGLALQPG